MASFTANRITVPSTTVDATNKHQPYGSLEVRRHHLELACKDEYELNEMLPLASVNPGIDNRVDTLLEQSGSSQQGGATDTFNGAELGETMQMLNDVHMAEVGGEEEELMPASGTAVGLRTLLKPAFTTELWLALAVRTVKQKAVPFVTIVLTMLALQSGMSEEMWNTLTFMMVLTSKRWVTAFCTDVAFELRRRLEMDEDISSNVRMVVGDNCDYQTRTIHEHTDRGGEYIHTVNWVTVPLRKSKLPAQWGTRSDMLPPGGWRRTDVSPFDVRAGFDPDDAEVRNLKEDAWRGFMEQAVSEEQRLRSEGAAAKRTHDILRHPDVPKPERTEVFYETPVFTEHGTAAYDDVSKWWGAVSRMWIYLLGVAKAPFVKPAAVILAVGDHQTWSRMLFLKLRNPAKYECLVPLPGEFHFLFHALMAIHILWWHAVVRHVVRTLNCTKTIKQDWNSIEKCKYYDHFYMITVVSLSSYLASTVPPALLAQPQRLLHAVRGNRAAVHAVRFLYEFGLPWLALRQAIRAGDAATINVMWRVAYHWFAVTGKTNYRIMSVMVTVITYLLVPELTIIWLLMRTASLSGHAGRNVAWDFVVERFNRTCKQALGTTVTRERLLNFLPVLNAFRHIWPRFRRSMGRGDGEPSDYSHVLPADFEAAATFWRSSLGEDFAALCEQRDNYAFDVGESDGGDGGGDDFRSGGKQGRSRKQQLYDVLQEGDCRGPADPWEVVLSHARSDEHEDVADDDEEPEYMIECIEQVRGAGARREYYVKWKGYSEKTWEPRQTLVDTEALEDFENQQAAKRAKPEAVGRSGDGGDGESAGSDSDGGDDPEEPYERKISQWYRDVSRLILTQTPLR